jgi:type I restriction enzyme S subunit
MQDLKEHIATKPSLRNIEGDLLPELRFKGFYEEWKETLLNNIAEFRKGKGISKSDIFDNGNLECIRYGELYTIYNEIIVKVVSKTNLPLEGLELSEYNDVIIPASGETQLDIATASCVLKSGVALSGDLNIIRSSLNGIFLSFYLNNKKKLEIAKLAQGSSVVHLYSSQLKSLKLNIPTLPEQQKIASFLSAVDEKTQQLTRKKELLEQYKKGVMQQLFSGKLRFKDENGKEYPEWEEKSLGEVAVFFKGKGISKIDIEEEGLIPCIRYGELYTYYKEIISLIKSSTNLNSKDLFFSKQNDVIIPASGETQIDIATASCVMVENIALGGDINIIRSSLNGIYLSYYLNNSKRNEIANLAQGSSVMHLYSSQLKTLKLYIPSILEQIKIANFLSSIDAKIESTTQQITQTQTFKKGLLQKMFV